MTIPKKMRALQLREIGCLEEVELAVPSPMPDELLIRTSATTICTSDLNDIRENPFNIPMPIVLGHEGAGTIADIGSNVTDFSVGDRVTAHPVIPCLSCDSCKRGLGHLCENMGHLAFDRDGTFAEYFCIPARRVRKVPTGMGMATAALLEPVAVCVEALRRSRLSSGESVLVVGDGPFGMLIARLAFRYAPSKVILVGRHDFRLAQVPAAICINEWRTENVLEAVLAATDGKGVDAAILGIGNGAAMDLCIKSLRARGRAAIFSAIGQPVPVDLFRVHLKELELIGSINDEDALDESLDSLRDPSLKMDSMVSHRLPFAEWEHAFELAAKGKDEALKVALIFEEA